MFILWAVTMKSPTHRYSISLLEDKNKTSALVELFLFIKDHFVSLNLSTEVCDNAAIKETILLLPNMGTATLDLTLSWRHELASWPTFAFLHSTTFLHL